MRHHAPWTPWKGDAAGRRWKRSETGWNPPLQWRWWALITAKQYQAESPARNAFTQQPAPHKRRTRQRGGNS